MKAPLSLVLLLTGCAGTGPTRPLQSYLDEQFLPADAPVVVVDIDDTIYERATETPLTGAAEALRDLSEDHLIVYLTARPTHAKVPWVTQNRDDSLEFLAANGFPDGPLFTSSLWNLLVHGQGEGKVRSFALLREFGIERVALAVGDRPHDLRAYLDNPHVPVERAIVILIEDETHADRDREALPDRLLERSLPGTGPAWPRILAAYDDGEIERAAVKVVSQPPLPEAGEQTPAVRVDPPSVPAP